MALFTLTPEAARDAADACRNLGIGIPDDLRHVAVVRDAYAKVESLPSRDHTVTAAGLHSELGWGNYNDGRRCGRGAYFARPPRLSNEKSLESRRYSHPSAPSCSYQGC